MMAEMMAMSYEVGLGLLLGGLLGLVVLSWAVIIGLAEAWARADRQRHRAWLKWMRERQEHTKGDVP